MIRRLISAGEEFFLAPCSARPLAALRIGLSLVLLLQAFLLRGATVDFFSRDGFVQGELAEYFNSPHAPTIALLGKLLPSLGLGEVGLIQLICGAYVVSLLFLGFGLYKTPAAAIAWFLHWTLTTTAGSTAYGVDLYAHVFLFYLIFIPAGDAWSLDVRRGRRSDAPSSWARVGLRLVQLQLCLTYFSSAVEKGMGPQWWNGELLWRALTLPEYRQFDFSWLASYPLLPRLGCWMSLLLEGGYFIYIWPRRTRPFAVAAIVLLHLGIAVFLGLLIFGLLMATLTLAIFGFSEIPIASQPGAETAP